MGPGERFHYGGGAGPNARRAVRRNLSLPIQRGATEAGLGYTDRLRPCRRYGLTAHAHAAAEPATMPPPREEGDRPW